MKIRSPEHAFALGGAATEARRKSAMLTSGAPSRCESLVGMLHQLNQLCQLRYVAIFQDKLALCEGREVTLRQAQVLAALSDRKPMAQAAICEATGIDRSTMSVILRRLAASGLVSRRRSSADSRVVGVSLTRRGSIVRAAGRKIMAELERDMLAPISDVDRIGLFKSLNEIVAQRSQSK